MTESMQLEKIVVLVMKFDEKLFSEIFLNQVTFWCQITNTGNTILEVVNLFSQFRGVLQPLASISNAICEFYSYSYKQRSNFSSFISLVLISV